MSNIKCIPSPLTFLGVKAVSDLDAIDADVVVMGIPCATPYLFVEQYGLSNLAGPLALRRATAQWAKMHDRIDWDVGTPMLDNQQDRVIDIGDLPVSFYEAEKNREVIKTTVEKVIAQGAVAIGLGGEDSVPTAMLMGLSQLEEVTVLQIDAHMDWREENGGERWGLSSGMRRASEFPYVKNIVQVGTRGPSSAGPQEIEDARKWGAKIFTGEMVHDDGIQPILDAIPEGANVHVNFDLDGLDPSVMPSVWVPTPGGLTYWQAMKLFRGVAEKANIVSFAVVEYVEERDPSGIAANTAARLTATVIGDILRNKRKK